MHENRRKYFFRTKRLFFCIIYDAVLSNFSGDSCRLRLRQKITILHMRMARRLNTEMENFANIKKNICLEFSHWKQT